MAKEQEEIQISDESRDEVWLSVNDLAAAGYRGVIRGYITHGPVVRAEKGELPDRQLRTAVAYFRSSMQRIIEHAFLHGRKDHIADKFPEISSDFDNLIPGNQSTTSRKISDFIETHLVKSDECEEIYVSSRAIAIMERDHRIISTDKGEKVNHKLDISKEKASGTSSISPESDHIKKGRGRSSR